MEDGFMEYRIYSAEYKVALIDEYNSRNISMRAFCDEKDLCLSTFVTWLKKVRQYGMPSIKANINNYSNETYSPMEVTKEAKQIILEEQLSETFYLETKGMKLTFSIKNLKEVLEVIKHD